MITFKQRLMKKASLTIIGDFDRFSTRHAKSKVQSSANAGPAIKYWSADLISFLIWLYQLII